MKLRILVRISIAALLCLVVSCGQDDRSASDDAFRQADSALSMTAAVAQADSFSRIAEELGQRVELLQRWFDRADEDLQQDSGTYRADTLFMAFRSELPRLVHTAMASLYEGEFQTLLWPEGAAADYRRRNGMPPVVPAEWEADALADSLVSLLAAGGIWPRRAEGGTHFEPSERALLNSFGRYVTEQIHAYIQFEITQQEKPFADDASLLVTPDEIGSRIVAAEQLLAAYPNSPANGEIEYRYRQYLATYLGGLPNAPAFEWQSRRLRPEFRKSYAQFLSRHRSTAAAQVLSDYLVLLGRAGFKRTTDVDTFLRNQWQRVTEH